MKSIWKTGPSPERRRAEREAERERKAAERERRRREVAERKMRNSILAKRLARILTLKKSIDGRLEQVARQQEALGVMLVEIIDGELPPAPNGIESADAIALTAQPNGHGEADLGCNHQRGASSKAQTTIHSKGEMVRGG